MHLSSILKFAAHAFLVIFIQCGFVCNGFGQQVNHSAKSTKNMVATVHPLATDAGVAAFEKGGNAIDAAIAACLTLGVVDGHNSGIGGGCFVLIRLADGGIVAIDGRETAPKMATRDMYIRDNKPDTTLSQLGALASGVPGAIAAYEKSVKDHGKMPFSDLVLPAAKIAEEGFVLDSVYASKLKAKQKDLAKFEGTRAVLLNKNGEPHSAGDRLIQSDLAQTYRIIASQGSSWFYEGGFPQIVEDWMKVNGGVMQAVDFANYEAKTREPIKTTYRDFEVIGFPPPSSGGVHVAQMLNILEEFDLKSIYERDPAQFTHLVVEAMKLAFADRAFWLGDADFADVPKGLVAKAYAKELSKKIDLKKAIKVESHGTPPNAKDDLFSKKHTTHICAADAEGNWVSITQTVNTTFGSKVIIPGTGVIMNNEMDDFSISPGTPNAFGLIGAEANAIAPGKRPLSSMSPTIILKDGKPVMAIGAAGGPKIISQVLLGIINHLDLKMPIANAVSAPRFHHQWSPDRILLENSNSKDLSEKLNSFGHEKILLSNVVGISQAISKYDDGKTFVGVHDSRIPGKAAGQK